MYKTEAKKDRIYGKGGRLLEDENWKYLYDEAGFLVKKTKNIKVEEEQNKTVAKARFEFLFCNGLNSYSK